MPAIVGFEQDPGGPPGAGTFAFEDGSQMPAYSPEQAAPFMQQAPPEPDMRLAQNSPQPAPMGAAPGEAPPQAPENAADVTSAPVASTPADVGRALRSLTYEGRVAEGREAPGIVHIPTGPSFDERSLSSTPEGQAILAARNEADVAAQQRTAQAAAVAQAYGAGAAPRPSGPARMLPRSATETRAGMGRPISDAELQEYDRLQGSAVGARVAQADRDTAQYRAQAAIINAQLPELQAEAAHRQAVLQKIQDDFHAKRQAVETEVNDAYAQKVDPDHYFAEMGTAGRIATAFGQAFGTYAAIVSGTPNYAAQHVDNLIARDIDAQKANLAASRGKADNQLSRLMQNYGMDVNEASSALQIQQRTVADQLAQRVAAGEKDKAVQDNLQNYLADSAQKSFAQKQAWKDRQEGTATRVLNSQMVQPGGGAAAGQSKDISSKAFELVKGGMPVDQAQAVAVRLVTGKAVPGTEGAAMPTKAGGGKGSSARIAFRLSSANQAVAEAEALVKQAETRSIGSTLSRSEGRQWGAATQAFNAHAKEAGIGGGDMPNPQDWDLNGSNLAVSRQLLAQAKARRDQLTKVLKASPGGASAEAGEYGMPDDAEAIDVGGGGGGGD